MIRIPLLHYVLTVRSKDTDGLRTAGGTKGAEKGSPQIGTELGIVGKTDLPIAGSVSAKQKGRNGMLIGSTKPRAATCGGTNVGTPRHDSAIDSSSTESGIGAGGCVASACFTFAAGGCLAMAPAWSFAEVATFVSPRVSPSTDPSRSACCSFSCRRSSLSTWTAICVHTELACRGRNQGKPPPGSFGAVEDSPSTVEDETPPSSLMVNPG